VIPDAVWNLIAGVSKGEGRTAAGLSTPKNLAILGGTGGLSVAQKTLLDTYFASEMIPGLLETPKRIMDAPNASEGIAAGVEGLINAYFTKGVVSGIGGHTPFVEDLAQIITSGELSKLKQRSPEKFHEALTEIFDGHDSLQIPVEQFDTYFQSKNINPAEVAQQIGAKNYLEAKVSGGHVEVAPQDFIGKLDSEHQKGLLGDVVDPQSGMTHNQKQEGEQELQKFIADGGIEKLRDTVTKADAETQASPEYQDVKTQLRQQYIDAGETPEVADNYATLQTNVYANLARETGMTPTELANLYRPVIRMGEAPGGNVAPPAPAPVGESPVSVASKPIPPRTSQDGTVQQLPVSKMALDPKRFQYKLNTDSTGVTNLLKGRQWNDELAGLISVWKDPKDGKVYVVNGHHRFQLAKENKVGSVWTRVIKADTPEEARSIGALQNIAEGRGTPMDAAKFFRDSGITPEKLDKLGISMGEATAAKGVALARLDPYIFDQVVSGKIREGRGVAIGAASDSPADQEALLKLINKSEAKGKRVSDDVVEELARMVKSAGQHTETQSGLFGVKELTKNLALEKADISTFVRSKIATERRIFQSVSQESKAAELGKVKGQTINAEKNAEIAQQATQAQEIYDRLSIRTGEVDDILNAAAKELAKGGNANAVKQRAYDSIRAEISKALAGSAGQGDSGVSEAAQSPETNPSGTLFQRRKLRPEDSLSFFGMENADRERANAQAAAEGELLTKELNSPSGSVSKDAGDMERNSPLFSGTGDNPTLFQGERGWFRVLSDGSFEIGKTKIGDLSTFVHEPAHSYLFLLNELSKREGASENLKGDYAKILDFLGAKDGEALTTEQHEKWARANEQYLREGKAPSEGLKGVFQRFSVWLSSIYKRASDLGVELSDDIRGVMDRLYASEDGVNRAAKESGDTGEVVDHAKAELLAKLNAASIREKTDAWKEEEQNAREAVSVRRSIASRSIKPSANFVKA
jgi:hypothetical protein